MKELVFLIGFRGTGKTTLGRLLARKLKYVFVDTDQRICQRKGASIKAIIDREGWDGFRRCEAEVLTELGDAVRSVIATGGGAVLHQRFWQAIKNKAIVIRLTADNSVLLQRLCRDTSTEENRPSLTGKAMSQEILEVLREREPLYREYADFTVDTGRLKARDAVDSIYKKLVKMIE
jgi:shikimate kinase